MRDEAAVGSLGGGAGEDCAVLGALADGDQNVGAGNGDGLVLVINGSELAVCVAHGDTAHKLYAGDLAVLAEDGLGRPRVVDDDAVGDACVLLVGNGGHLFVLLKAVHVDAAAGQTLCRACHVDGRVAAADNDNVAGKLLSRAAVDGAQEVKTALNACQLFTGNVELCGLLETDSDVEGPEALLAELLDGDILADLNAAAELDAHLTQDVYLGLDDVLADAEGGDAVDEHTAGGGFLIEYDRAVTLDGEEVRAGHTCGACADYCDLLVKLLMRAGVHGGHVAVLGLHVLLGDEFLYLVDGERLVDAAAGACVLAVLAADAAADGGEGVILLDELESVRIAAIGGHLYVALNGYVSGAGDLAGRGAGRPGLDGAVLVSVILVPVILAPLGVIGQLVARVLDGAFLGAELLAEAYRTGGTCLNALAAGDALFGIGLGGVGGSGEVRGVEELGGAQSVANADSAVADTEDLVLAVDVGYLVDIALVLGLLKDLHGLFIGDVAAVVGLAAVVGKVADADAPFALDVAGAFAADALLLTAGTDRYADVTLVLLQPVAEMLDRQGLALCGDGFLNGDDVHTDACASGRHHLGDTGQRQVCHALEEVRGFGVHVGLFGVYHHNLCAAGDEHVQHPALLVVRVLAVEVFPVELDKAAFADGLHGLLKVCAVKLRVLLRKLLDGKRHALFHRKTDVENVVGHLLVVLVGGVLQRGVDAQILRGFGSDLVLAEQYGSPVGNFLTEFCDFFVFRHGIFKPPDR